MVVFVVLVLIAPVPADGFEAALVAGFIVPVAGLAVVLVAGLTVEDVVGFVVVVATVLVVGVAAGLVVEVAGLLVVLAGLTVLPFAGLVVGVIPEARCVLTAGLDVVVDAGRAAGVPVLVPVEADDLTGAAPVEVAVRLTSEVVVLPAGRRIGTTTGVVLIESATGRIVGAPIGVYTSVTQPDGLRVCAPPLAYTSTYCPVVFSCKAFWFICLFVASQTLAMCE